MSCIATLSAASCRIRPGAGPGSRALSTTLWQSSRVSSLCGQAGSEHRAPGPAQTHLQAHYTVVVVVVKVPQPGIQTPVTKWPNVKYARHAASALCDALPCLSLPCFQARRKAPHTRPHDPGPICFLEAAHIRETSTALHARRQHRALGGPSPSRCQVSMPHGRLVTRTGPCLRLNHRNNKNKHSICLGRLDRGPKPGLIKPPGRYGA